VKYSYVMNRHNCIDGAIFSPSSRPRLIRSRHCELPAKKSCVHDRCILWSASGHAAARQQK